jgi:putative peptidoglycan lipid II flippase
VLAPGFYARQNIKTPVRIAIVTLLATQILNAALIGPLKHAGLALAIGLGACLNAGLLYVRLRQMKLFTPQPGWFSFAAKVLVAVVAMSLILWFAMGQAQWWLQSDGTWRVARLSGIVVAGAAGYFATLWLLGFRPRDFSRRGA